MNAILAHLFSSRNIVEILEELLFAIPAPLFVKGADCRLAVINPACQRLLGVTGEDLKQRTPRRYEKAGSSSGYMGVDKEIFSSGEARTVHEIFYHSSGGKDGVELITTKSPVYDESGNPLCLICAPSKADQFSVMGNDPKLLHLQRLSMLGMLTSKVSHDIRNALSGIKGATMFLRKHTEGNGEANKWIERIDSSCNHALSLLEQVMSIGSGNKAGTREVVELGEVFNKVEGILRISPELVLSVEVSKGAYVYGNVVELCQVFINLCLNSLQAKKGHECNVSIHVQEVVIGERETPGLSTQPAFGVYHCISVSDDGKGMEQEIIEKVFDPFFTTGGSTSNTGLGLTIVRDVVVSHGGMIKVESAIGSGTTMHVFLPKH